MRRDSQLLARRTTPPQQRNIGGPLLSGSARAAVLRYERRSGLLRGSLLRALQVWSHSPAVTEPPVTSCGIWECCLFIRPVPETRDMIEDLIRRTSSRAGRELRKHVRDADIRMVGPVSGFWWRNQRFWRLQEDV